MGKKISIKILIFIIYSIVIFCIGFNCGNVKSSNESIEQHLEASKNLFQAQGDKPEQIEAILEVMRISELEKIGGIKRQLFSIYLPSILIVINIILTVIFKRIN